MLVNRKQIWQRFAKVANIFLKIFQEINLGCKNFFFHLCNHESNRCKISLPIFSICFAINQRFTNIDQTLGHCFGFYCQRFANVVNIFFNIFKEIKFSLYKYLIFLFQQLCVHQIAHISSSILIILFAINQRFANIGKMLAYCFFFLLIFFSQLKITFCCN